MSDDFNLVSDRNHSSLFSEYAHYYDLLYRDKNYQAEADYVAGLIHRFQPDAQSILELGSGTGIHANLLAKQGYRVHGIERSQEMLVRAQNAAQAFKQTSSIGQLDFSQGDIRTVRLSKHFDVVMALFHVMSYQTTNDDVLAAFRVAREHLKEGSLFIFDVWYGPAVMTERPEVRVKRMADDQVEITRLAEPVLFPNENRVDVHYHIFVRNLVTQVVTEVKESHSMRYFFNPEIEWIAHQTGFHCLHVEEWLSRKVIGCDTWGVCFTLQVV
jgi:SAM-dependent methyltransferase